VAIHDAPVLWSSAVLSQARAAATSTTVGNQAIFAGGYSGYVYGTAGYDWAVDVATVPVPEPRSVYLLAVVAISLGAEQFRRANNRLRS
jgi:hypothetical protein